VEVTTNHEGRGRLLHDGTVGIVAGTFVAGVAAYVYQIAGGRVLGAEDFAPVSVLLTLHFIAFVVVLIPVEQLVIRAVTLGTSGDRSVNRAALVVVVGSVVTVLAVSMVYRERFFAGSVVLVAATGATVLTHAVFAVGRGRLAGATLYRSYGAASGAAGLLRVAVAFGILAVSPSAGGLAAALVIGPLVILVWWPRTQEASSGTMPGSASRFLTGVVLASGASQLLLLAGPVVAAVVGASAVEVSVLFGTLTLFRAPLTFGYNLLARLLPPFTRMVEAGQEAELRRWGVGIGIAGGLLAGAAAVVGRWLGPGVVALSFGEEFRPDSTVAMLVAAGVVASAAALFTGEVLVARAETGRLAWAWAVGLAGAAVTVLATGDDPQGVAAGFLAGEMVALAAIMSAVVGHRAGLGYAVAKRILDLGMSVLVLILAAPIWLVSALAIRLDSPGPLLFRQERVGLNGERFALLKFRTMRDGSSSEVLSEHLEQLAISPDERLRIELDPRVTRVGRFLRRWAIDELPNFLTVFTGKLSLVGPRPLVPEEVALLGADGKQRTRVKPGITGLAQVRGRDEISLADRISYDLEYVEKRSFGLDLAILLRTVPALRRR
jgi:lipopolysaccharide/colanic/teichoic acid biosynthesis glycosyltransferase